MPTSKAWKQKAMELFKTQPYFAYSDKTNMKVWKVSHLVFAQSFVINGNKQRIYIGSVMCWNMKTDKIDFVNL